MRAPFPSSPTAPLASPTGTGAAPQGGALGPQPAQPASTFEILPWQMAVQRLDEARASLAAGETAHAITQIRHTLTEFPDEPALVRFLGVALLHEGDYQGAAEAIARAHRTDPSLADRPLTVRAFQRERRTIESILGRVAPLANRSGSPDLWLVAVVLNQALGRDAQAARLLDRAIDAGLEIDVASALAAALDR